MLDLDVIHNGIFVPSDRIKKYPLIYDANYNLVENSSLRRGKDGCEDVSNASGLLNHTLRESAEYIDEIAVFLGFFDVSHYGHWLTEGLSRFWYLDSAPHQNFKIPLSNTLRRAVGRVWNLTANRNKVHWHKAVGAFHLEDKIVKTGVPLQFREIHVPGCSMINRGHIHPEHLGTTRKLASAICETSSLEIDERPVYLSRTKLGKGVHLFVGEQSVEDFCRDKGFKVVYPERLSLEEQICLFNQHDVFSGLVGSAFHSLLFRQDGRKKATCIYLTHGKMPLNVANIDKLMGNDSIFVDCCEPVSDSKGTLLCNDEAAVSGIRRHLDI